MHPATNPPRAVPRKVPNGAPPYAGCTACHSPNATAMSTSALSRADSGGPRRARRNASSSVTSATVVSAIKKKTNGATNPDGADGRSSAMTAASGRSAAPAAAAYQCHSVRWRVVATAAPDAAATRDAASAMGARAERSSELDMALAHPDRPRPEIDQQRPVGTEPAGAARRRRAQLTAPQPVTRGEGGAFPLRERRLEPADRDQRGHEPVQQVQAAHLWEALLQGHGGTPHGSRHGVAHVDTDAHREPLQPISLPTALAQNAGDLAVVEQHVVGPLEPRPRRAEQSVNGVGDGQAGPDRHRSHHRMRGPEQHAEPDPSHGRTRGAAGATTARRRLFGNS